VRERVQRHRDVEVIFQLTDQFEHLKGIEAEVLQKLVVRPRFDRSAAQAFDDLGGVALEAVWN